MKKLLYLDDSRAALMHMAKMLEDIGEILLASTPEEAEEIMLRENIEFFLVDYTLGEKNGIDFSKGVRKCPQYAKTPIMLISASYTEQMAYEAIKAGINQCFAKPIEKNSFKSAITKQLEAPYIVHVMPKSLRVKCYSWEKAGYFYQYSPQIEQLVRDTSMEDVRQKMQVLLRKNLKNQLDELEFIVDKAAVHYTINIED